MTDQKTRHLLTNLLSALDKAGALNIYLHTIRFRDREDDTSAAIRAAATAVDFDLSHYDRSRYEEHRD